MFNAMNTDEIRLTAHGLLMRGVEEGAPIAKAHLAVQMLLKAAGRPIPRDVLAWVSCGQISDTQVTNWDSPFGD